MQRAHPAEVVLARAQWQPSLFADLPSRFELAKLKPIWRTEPLVVRVHRNHAFEHVAAASVPWFAWWGREPKFQYSDYDDSLSFDFSSADRADLELIWLDLSRYLRRFDPAELANWLGGRLTALRARSSLPILIIALDSDGSFYDRLLEAVRSVPGVRFGDLRPIATKLGNRFLDERASRFSGTRLGDPACILIAREFACRWSPAMLQPRLKAVALDLDHTLYEGALGEDGTRVNLASSHADLQRYLVELRDQGVFLALVSRNEEADVRQLFEERADFPLHWEHFSATAASWGSKAEALQRIARQLHISPEAMLFVDDNPGELAAVVTELSMIPTAHAMPDAARTRCLLEYYPGLWAWERSATDALRAADLKAETERVRLAADASDPREYLRSLQVNIRVELSPRDHLTRLHELSQKTNQFNLNLARLSEVDIANTLDATDQCIAAVGLTDRLSDSGLIALVAARRTQDTLIVYEVAISCRALGRKLEDLFVAEAVRAILNELPSLEVCFLYRSGPRNNPARQWLARLTGNPLSSEGTVFATKPLKRVSAESYPVHLEIVNHEPNRNRATAC